MEWVYALMVATSVPLSIIGGLFYMGKNYTLSKKQRKELMAHIDTIRGENVALRGRLEVLENIAISLSDGEVSPDEAAQFEELEQTIRRTHS